MLRGRRWDSYFMTKGNNFQWEADTSNDSIIAFITLGVSLLESTVGNKCLGEKKSGVGEGQLPQWIFPFLVCQNEPPGPIVNIVEK